MFALGLTSGAIGAVLVALDPTAGTWLSLLTTVPLGFTAMAMPAMTLAMAIGRGSVQDSPPAS